MRLIFKRKIDYLTFQLKLQYYDLSENELKLVALLYLGGINDKVKATAVKMGVFKSKQSIDNHISKFRRLGIIKQDKVVLLEPIETELAETEINLTLCIQH